MNTFSNLEIFLTGKLHSLLATYLSVFSSKMVFLLQSGATILVLYYGYSIMTLRGSNATLREMMFNLARIGIVLVFVQNSSGMLNLAIGFIHELKTEFIEEKSLFALLDEQFSMAQRLSQTAYKIDTAMFPVRGGLSSLMIWLGAIFVITSSFIVFIAAEVGIALLTVTSPIFVGCLTYGFTRELFNGWLRSVFSSIITLIFASLVVKIGLDINNEALTQLIVAPSQDSLMTIGAVALGLGIIISSLTLVATKMAGNIAGVATTSAVQGGMVLAAKAGMVSTAQAGIVGTKLGAAAAVGTVKGAVATAKYASNKISDIRKKRDAAFKRIQLENLKGDS